jgi:hypothetical protein
MIAAPIVDAPLAKTRLSDCPQWRQKPPAATSGMAESPALSGPVMRSADAADGRAPARARALTPDINNIEETK